MDLQSLKDGMGFHVGPSRNGEFAFGSRPAYHTPSKLTPRDRDLIREIYNEGVATRRELAWAFGVHYNTIYNHTN